MAATDVATSVPARQALAAGMALSLTSSYARADGDAPQQFVLDGMSAWSGARHDETADPLTALEQFWQWRAVPWPGGRSSSPRPRLAAAKATPTARTRSAFPGDGADSDSRASALEPQPPCSLDSFWTTVSGRHRYTRNDYYRDSVNDGSKWVPDPAADPWHPDGVDAQHPPVIRGGAQGSAQVEAGARVYNDLGHEFLAYRMFDGWHRTILAAGEVRVGDAIETRDSPTSQHWREAKVLAVSGTNGVKIHYPGWDSSYDETILPKTSRLRQKKPRNDRSLLHSGRLWPTHAPPLTALEKRGQRRPLGQAPASLKPEDRELFRKEKERQAEERLRVAVEEVETNQLKARALQSALARASADKLRAEAQQEEDARSDLGVRQIVAELANCLRERSAHGQPGATPRKEPAGTQQEQTDDIAEYFERSLELWKEARAHDDRSDSTIADDEPLPLQGDSPPAQRFGSMQESAAHAEQLLGAQVSSQAVLDAIARVGDQHTIAHPQHARQSAVSTARAVKAMDVAERPAAADVDSEENIEVVAGVIRARPSVPPESGAADLEVLFPGTFSTPTPPTTPRSLSTAKDLLSVVSARWHSANPPVPQPPPRTPRRVEDAGAKIRAAATAGARAERRQQKQQHHEKEQQQSLEEHFPGMFTPTAPRSPSNSMRSAAAAAAVANGKVGGGNGVLDLPFETTAAGITALLTPRASKTPRAPPPRRTG